MPRSIDTIVKGQTPNDEGARDRGPGTPFTRHLGLIVLLSGSRAPGNGKPGC